MHLGFMVKESLLGISPHPAVSYATDPIKSTNYRSFSEVGKGPRISK